MATFWDEDGTSGWAEQAVEAAKPVTAKPSKEEMQKAWNENKGDPAKIHELMKANGVGVKEVAGILGASQQEVAGYLNSGRSGGILRSGYGDDMNVAEQFKYDEVTPEPQTREEFMATVEPGMLDESGKFKGPAGNVNYRWEGMTPEQVFEYRQRQLAPADPAMAMDGQDGNKPVYLPGNSPNDEINLKWEAGPDNGGGAIGGLARGIGGIATGVAKNPALMAALTAGVGSAFSPASGSMAAGADMAAAPSALQTYGQQVMSSPFAQPAMNAAKTLVSGGDLGDAALAAGGSYLGSEASGILGGGTVGQVGGSLVNAAVTGKDPLQTLVSAGANAAAGAITGNVPGFEALSPSQQSAVTAVVAQALRGKDPTQALIANVTKLATGQVSGAKPQTSNTKTGGWSA